MGINEGLKVKVVILAGRMQSALRDEHEGIPKPMIDIHNRCARTY